MKKRILSLLLCLCMSLSLLPINVMAEDDGFVGEITETAENEAENRILAEEENPSEEPAGEPSEDSAEGIPAAENEEGTLILGEEEAVEESAEVPTEEPSEEPVENPAEEPTEESIEGLIEGLDGEPVGVPVEEAAEESIEEPAEEPTEEPTEERIRVEFVLDPENATVKVYIIENKEIEEEPESDGSYLLLPGEYWYEVSCDGYATAEWSFELTADAEQPVRVEVTLDSIPAEESASEESVEDGVLNVQANEPEEPAAEEPEVPAAEEPEEPAAEEPEEPAAEEPEGPAAEEPEEPAAEEPEEPAAEEPEEPAAEEPEGPAAEEPEESAAEEPKKTVAKEPEEPAAEEPIEPATKESEEPEAVLVRVEFSCDPKETLISVYNPAHPDKNGEPMLIEPEKDGGYLLLPGEYLFDAECKEYIAAKKTTFTVEKEDLIIPVSLKPVTGEEENDAPEENGKKGTPNYRYSVDNGQVTIVEYTGDAEVITIPSSLGGYPVKTIGNLAFCDCDCLKSVTIPSSVTELGYMVFKDCKNLVSVHFNEGTAVIGTAPFSGCTKLTSVTLPSTLEAIPIQAFSRCSSLETLSIPEGVITINNGAFDYCSSLASVSIPASVSDINTRAFLYSFGLKSISVNSGNKNYKSANGVLFSKDGSVLIRYPAAKTDSSYTIPSTVNTISEYAFFGCSKLTKLTIPADVTTFGDDVFSEAELLTSAGPLGSGCSVEFGWTNTIPRYAFSGAPFTSVTIPATITRLEDYSFYGCDLTSLTVPHSVVAIEDFAFAWCTNLTKVTILDGTVSIGEGAFYYDQAMETIKLPASLSSIGFRAFQYSLNGEMYPNLDVKMYVESGSYGESYARNKGFAYVVAPKIEVQPQGCTVTEGSKAIFTVTAAGSEITYQWYYKYPGATEWKTITAGSGKTASYSLTTEYRHNGYQYRCKIKNEAGTVTSAAVTLTVNPKKPSITTQPKSTTVSSGSTATFKVVASGSGLSYQWQFSGDGGKSWKNITSSSYTGVKTATMKVPATPARSGNRYRCIVKNSAGTVYSNTVKLTVLTNPTISKQPSAATASSGTSAKFSVTASGGELSYQWQYYNVGSKTWDNITNTSYTGVKTATMTVPATSSRDGLLYRCRITNALGTVNSSSAKLTVIPGISKQPASATAASGSTVKFSITASGSGLSYQWQYSVDSGTSWDNITNTSYSGVKTATLSVQAITSRNGFRYRCKVTNSSGSVYSNTAKLTVVTTPSITKQPTALQAACGTTATFKVTASGGVLSYQWQCSTDGGKTWKNITSSSYSGVKTATLTFPATAERSGNRYRCVVTNAAGSVTSSSAKLTAVTEPRLTRYSSAASTSCPATVKFFVEATGGGLSYQWQYSSNGGNTWGNITNSSYSGIHSNTLSVPATYERSGYQYRCKVWNVAGTVYSPPATLTVG